MRSLPKTGSHLSGSAPGAATGGQNEDVNSARFDAGHDPGGGRRPGRDSAAQGHLERNWQILLFGTTEHLSGSPQNTVVRDLEVTHTVTGQDGRLIWGTTSSANNDSKEPFAWALAADNRSITGADTDGYYRITIVSADGIEKCYAQSATGPRRAIVATCFMMDRVKN
jgi:hypothetical protein